MATTLADKAREALARTEIRQERSSDGRSVSFLDTVLSYEQLQKELVKLPDTVELVTFRRLFSFSPEAETLSRFNGNSGGSLGGWYGPKVKFSGNVRLDRDVIVTGDSEINNSNVLDRVIIADSIVSGCILRDDVKISVRSNLRGNTRIPIIIAGDTEASNVTLSSDRLLRSGCPYSRSFTYKFESTEELNRCRLTYEIKKEVR